MATPAKTPARIEEYRHIRPLGSGGFGEVHLYQHVGTDAAVAIKLLRDGALAIGGAAQLLKEARALGRLSASGPHPNIVAVQHVGQLGDRPYLVMEYCPEGSWADEIKKSGRVHPSAVLSVGIQIAGALHMAHLKEIVHRDIKPSNILFGVRVGGQATPKLADFGIAALSAEDVTRGSEGVSRDYAAPEVVRTREADQRSDLFSLAATLYHALAGISWVRRHGEDNSVAVLESRVLAGAIPRIEGADIPEELQWLIRSAMHADPSTRQRNIGTAKDFALRLQDIQMRENYGFTPVPVSDPVEADPAAEAAQSWIPAQADPVPSDGSFDSLAGQGSLAGHTARPDTEPAIRGPQVEPDQVPNGPPPTSRKRMLMVGAVVVAVAAGAVVAVNMLSGPGEAPVVRPSAKSVGDNAVPELSVLPIPTIAVERDATGKAIFRWTYAPVVPEDRFNVQRAGTAVTEIVDRPQWTPPDGTGSGVCLRVSIIRNGLVGEASTQVCA